MPDNYFKVVVSGHIVGVETFESDDLSAAERAYARAEASAKAAGGSVVVLRVPEPLATAPPFSLVRSASACPQGCCIWVREEPPRKRDGRPGTSRPGWTCARCNRHKAARGSDDEEL